MSDDKIAVYQQKYIASLEANSRIQEELKDTVINFKEESTTLHEKIAAVEKEKFEMLKKTYEEMDILRAAARKEIDATKEATRKEVDELKATARKEVDDLKVAACKELEDLKREAQKKMKDECMKHRQEMEKATRQNRKEAIQEVKNAILNPSHDAQILSETKRRKIDMQQSVAKHGINPGISVDNMKFQLYSMRKLEILEKEFDKNDTVSDVLTSASTGASTGAWNNNVEEID